MASFAQVRPGRVAFLVALATACVVGGGLAADRRFTPAGGPAGDADLVRQAIWSGPIVGPVRRAMPVTPPWSAALVAAGDIVPPVLAPDIAPLPVRKNAALARAHRHAAAVPSSGDGQAGRLEARTALADRTTASVSD